MTPTDELREELRELINEVIPLPEEDTATRFTNAQIDRILTRATDIYAAASQGWTLKADKIQDEMGNLKSYSVGQEKYDFVDLEKAVQFALGRAKYYKELSEAETGVGGSRILSVTPPAVL